MLGKDLSRLPKSLQRANHLKRKKQLGKDLLAVSIAAFLSCAIIAFVSN